MIDATLRQPQQAHDQQDRARDQQDLVPAALVGQEHGAGRGHCDHTWESYGLG
jgi:hypothetical protein